MIFKSLRDLSNDIQMKLLPQLPRDIGVVYGIPRSGMLPAAILATALGAKLGMIHGAQTYGSRHKHRVLPEGGKVLLVDDSIHTGAAMLAARSRMRTQEEVHYTCAVYAHSLSVHSVDFYAEVLDCQRLFEWNFTGITATKSFCWDMDGVICTDPIVYDDDGEIYRAHIVNHVRPLYLPQVKVKAIITNRIERWRNETEVWLKRYGVHYERLIMQPWSTATERRRKSRAAEFKAKQLTDLHGTVFIESHDEQAKEIAALSGKPVLSIESMKLFDVGGRLAPNTLS